MSLTFPRIWHYKPHQMDLTVACGIHVDDEVEALYVPCTDTHQVTCIKCKESQSYINAISILEIGYDNKWRTYLKDYTNIYYANSKDS